MSHEYTIDNQCYVVSNQHGGNEIVRVLVEHGEYAINQAVILVLFQLKPKFV